MFRILDFFRLCKELNCTCKLHFIITPDDTKFMKIFIDDIFDVNEDMNFHIGLVLRFGQESFMKASHRNLNRNSRNEVDMVVVDDFTGVVLSKHIFLGH